jgi:hypothetical protein
VDGNVDWHHDGNADHILADFTPTFGCSATLFVNVNLLKHQKHNFLMSCIRIKNVSKMFLQKKSIFKQIKYMGSFFSFLNQSQ